MTRSDPPREADTSPAGPSLPERDRNLLRILLTEFATTGEIPSREALAEASGLAPAVMTQRLRALAEGDYLTFDLAGRPTCLYPFSPVPTPHVVTIAGYQRYAMCSIDALGIAAMLDQEVVIEGECAHCHRAVRLVVRPGEVVHRDPPETVVVARRDESGPAVGSCCPVTVFACSASHAQELVGRVPGSVILSLPDALHEGEQIFGDLLRAERLPRSRCHVAPLGT